MDLAQLTNRAAALAPSGTSLLRREIGRVIPSRPFNLQFWDGTSLPATSEDAPSFVVESPEALAHFIRSPDQLGLGRAYVNGTLTVDDLDAAFIVVDTWEPPPIGLADRLRLMAAALAACRPWALPKTPELELILDGERHTIDRDKQAIRYHYDVGNDFFALFLDRSMTYSCAIFSRGAQTLEEAQRTKLDLVATKLRAQGGRPGSRRRLRLGQLRGPRGPRVRREGPRHHDLRRAGRARQGADRRVRPVGPDRDPGGRLPRDHRRAVRRDRQHRHGRARRREPDRRLCRDARQDAQADRRPAQPRNRVLSPDDDPLEDIFSTRYVFPDGEPLSLSRIQLAFERAALETHHVEGFGRDYATTLRHWHDRLDARIDEAEAIAGVERTRIWRLYLRAARHGFEVGFTNVYQVLARHRDQH